MARRDGVGSPGDHHLIQVQLEGALDLPHAVQVVLVLGGVGGDEAASGVLELAVGVGW